MKPRAKRINVRRVREASGLSGAASAEVDPLLVQDVDWDAIDRNKKAWSLFHAMVREAKAKMLPPPRGDLRAAPPSPPPGYGAPPWREEQQLPEIEEVDLHPATARMDAA